VAIEMQFRDRGPLSQNFFLGCIACAVSSDAAGASGAGLGGEAVRRRRGEAAESESQNSQGGGIYLTRN
jgi:hypothetical protein